MRSEEPSVPNQLFSDGITPVIEVGTVAGFAGRGNTKTDTIDNTYVAGTANTLIDLRDEKKGALLIGMRLIASAGAAGATFAYAHRVAMAATVNLILFDRAMVAGDDLTWMDIVGRPDTRIYVPPGAQVVYSFSAAPGAGQGYTVIAQWLEFPAGLQPW